MIIWGSGGGETNLAPTEHRHCETCEKERPFQLLLHYRYAHVYFFRWVTERKYHFVCEICRRGWQLEADDIKPTLDSDPIPFMTRFGWTIPIVILAWLILPIVVGAIFS
jgi:hypothetical protein